MQKIVKQVCGLDVAQKELVVTVGRVFEDFNLELFAYKVFANNPTGFKQLLKWVKSLCYADVSVSYVMEATGVYHEKLAYFLHQQNKYVVIVLPNKISNYFRTLDVRTITYKTASEAIARFGLERKLDRWVPASPLYKKLRQLTRERDQIVLQRTAAKNQLHAEQTEAEPNTGSIKRQKRQIAFFDKLEEEIKKELDIMVKSNQELKEKVKIISSIPGYANLSATIILAETNGFELIRNKKQLAAYTGLDVIEKQSGTSVKGKSKISKKGNRYLRKCLYLPALSAIRSNEGFNSVSSRIVLKSGIKMKGAVAVQRKMLELAYTLVNNNTMFDKNYNKKNKEQQEVAPCTS
jgi:transposase